MAVSPRILFVDDDAHMRDILSLYLGDNGIEAMAVATGQRARELFCQVPFDLTILDLNLASEDCLGMLNFIKGKDSKHPVIIFTAVDDDELFLKKALLGRAEAVVRKMSSLTSLLAEVRQHLPKSSSTGQAHSGPGPRS
jgi:two-component system response regulator RstA